jgi:hypothetical protein
MSELKKYTSFEALKLVEKSNNVDQSGNSSFSEFEVFLRKLQSAYSNKMKFARN